MEDLIKKNFIRSSHYYQKSFSNPKKRNEILKNILDENITKEIFSNNKNLLGCKILLNKNQEQHLFRKYNYLKYRIFKILKDKKIGSCKKRIEIDKRLLEIIKIREIILKCNMRLIVKCVCNHFTKDSVLYEEFFSNSYLHMIRAIDCFDYRKKYKFSTYFVNVLFRNLFRDKTRIKSYSELDELMLEQDANYLEFNEKYNINFIKNALDLLDSRENNKSRSIIIKKYYGICGEKRLNDKQIAKQLGVSKSRVQQLRKNALEKIKNLNLIYDPVF